MVHRNQISDVLLTVIIHSQHRVQHPIHLWRRTDFAARWIRTIVEMFNTAVLIELSSSGRRQYDFVRRKHVHVLARSFARFVGVRIGDPESEWSIIAVFGSVAAEMVAIGNSV